MHLNTLFVKQRISPDFKRMAYVDEELLTEDRHITTANLDGSDKVRLLNIMKELPIGKKDEGCNNRDSF